jgi:hypothetical protein
MRMPQVKRIETEPIWNSERLVCAPAAQMNGECPIDRAALQIHGTKVPGKWVNAKEALAFLRTELHAVAIIRGVGLANPRNTFPK